MTTTIDMSLPGLKSQMSGSHRLRVLSVGCDGGAGDGDSVACECDAIALAPVRWMGMESGEDPPADVLAYGRTTCKSNGKGA